MKIGRNEPCHCGSGKKYKQCCLHKDEDAQLTQYAVASERRAEQEKEHKAALRAEREFHKNELRSAMEAFTAENTAREDEWEEEEYEEDRGNSDRDWDDDDDDNAGDLDEEPLEESRAEIEDELEEEETTPLSPEEKQKQKLERAEAEAFWEKFKEQNLSGKIGIFEGKLAESAPLQGGYAFDMLSSIHRDAVQNNARELYPPLIAKLRQSSPKAYRKNSSHYLENLITEAIVAERFADLPALVQELAGTAGRNPDTFGKVLAQLAYYNRLDLFNAALRLAWPIIRKSVDIVPWAIDEYAAEGVRGLVCDYLERNGASTAGDAALFRAVRFFTKVPHVRLNRFIALIAGHDQREWRAEDFDFKKKKPERRNTEATPAQFSARENLINLSMSFQGYVHRTRNISLIKSELGRETLVKYFFKRLNGDLKPRQSMMEAALRPKPAHLLKDPPYHPEWPPHVRVLCPHPPTFERFLVGMLHFLNPEHYKLAAMFELVPVWLEFLVAQKLIEPLQQEATMQGILHLRGDMLKIFEHYNAEPALQQTLLRWPEQAA